MVTEPYMKLKEAENAFDHDPLNAEVIKELQSAHTAYDTMLTQYCAEWDALPEGEEKDIAADNAHDTEGTEEDKLYWYGIALATYGSKEYELEEYTMEL